MNLQSGKCDQSHISELMAGQLSTADEAALEEHLSSCESCRDALRDASADKELWDKAGLYLRDENDELCPLSSSHEGDSGELRGRNSIIDLVLDSLAPTDDPEMLGRIGDYEISGVIGCGGMGAVLKGFDRSLKRVVAVKVMAPHLASSGAARKRFAREAQAAAAMTHENVIDIYGVSEANGLPYLVMPYSRGTSLQKRIDQRGPLPVVEVLRIGSQIAAGLAAAHEQGLVHRDIKPANILLSDGVERLVITDFGLARAVDDASVTRTGVIAGTPQYMSPEQARGESVDHRSDLFSLGSVLYTLCTGRPPFRAEGAYGILRRITDNEPRSIREINPEIPQWLCRIIARLHAKSPDDRYQSASEVAELLQQCLAHLQTPNAPLPMELQAPQRWSRRVVFALMTALAVSVVGWIWNADLAERLRAPAGVPPSESAAQRGAPPSDRLEGLRPSATSEPLSESESELMWIDPYSPNAGDVHASARNLANETRSFFKTPSE